MDNIIHPRLSVCSLRDFSGTFVTSIPEKRSTFSKILLVCDSFHRHLHSMGIGTESKPTEVLTREDEERLWESGILSTDTPDSLSNAVFFLNGKNFCLHGGTDHRKLTFSQLKWGGDTSERKNDGEVCVY